MKMVRLNNRVRKASQSGSRGFALVEVLIAIALLGIIAITFLSGLFTSYTVSFTADERTTAESLARRQMEYVKSQDYNSTGSVLNEPTYIKIGGIPEGYSIWSVNRNGAVVADIVGIPWDSEKNKPANKDEGLQKIALVIKHKDQKNPANPDKVIYTFINDNPYWADGVQITLEGYKVNR